MDLFSVLMFQKNLKGVKKILDMPEWNQGKFQGLLTPNIWKNNYESVVKKLYLPYLKEKKYEHLLVPSIFSIPVSKIENGIDLLKKYNIDAYITIRCLRFETTTLEGLIEYLINNNIDLIVSDELTGKLRLNPILSCEKVLLKKRFGIDIEDIEKKKRGSR